MVVAHFRGTKLVGSGNPGPRRNLIDGQSQVEIGHYWIPERGNPPFRAETGLPDWEFVYPEIHKSEGRFSPIPEGSGNRGQQNAQTVGWIDRQYWAVWARVSLSTRPHAL